jgi:hypothetical protein
MLVGLIAQQVARIRLEERYLAARPSLSPRVR